MARWFSAQVSRMAENIARRGEVLIVQLLSTEPRLAGPLFIRQIKLGDK
jgi:hypothetical protein